MDTGSTTTVVELEKKNLRDALKFVLATTMDKDTQYWACVLGDLGRQKFHRLPRQSADYFVNAVVYFIQPKFSHFTSFPVLLGLILSLSDCSRKADDQGISHTKGCELVSKNMPSPVYTVKLSSEG